MTVRTAGALYEIKAPGEARAPDWAAGPAAALRALAPAGSAVAVALRRDDRRAVVTFGATERDGGVPVTADTLFETGSLTKCFTALLLAEQVARGEIGYGDPLARFLPPEALPRARGWPITPLHLVTHTSGLPRQPPGLPATAVREWFTNPYARFSTDDLLRSLAATRPRARPGERVRYSNFGVGLLGHLLTVAAPGHRGYGDLLAARVLEPLGLRHTTGSPEAGRATQATGYWHERARPPWRIPGLAGAGAVRSSARDLLALLDALTDGGPGDPPGRPGPPPSLRAALTDVVRPRLALRGGTRRLALVWNIRVRPGGDVYHHSGGTRGFSSFAGFCPDHRTALVALVNTGPGSAQRFLQGAYEALLSLAPSR
ncbi:serine hydrolase domain-containing protein [Streptomyces sp. NPDC087658]|uniref:serine hydrolase domain-containing protein n=1 Tax=Streptomyces sp. NPDC087658 TaxID=3365800 RepID=UPI00382E79F7